MRSGIVRIESNGLFELVFGRAPIPVLKEIDDPQTRMGLRERRIESQRLDASFRCFGKSFFGRKIAARSQNVIRVRNADIGESVARIFGDGFLVIVETLP